MDDSRRQFCHEFLNGIGESRFAMEARSSEKMIPRKGNARSNATTVTSLAN